MIVVACLLSVRFEIRGTKEEENIVTADRQFDAQASHHVVSNTIRQYGVTAGMLISTTK